MSSCSTLTASMFHNSVSIELFNSLLCNICDSRQLEAIKSSVTVYIIIMCVCLHSSQHVLSAALVQVFTTFTNCLWASNIERSEVWFVYCNVWMKHRLSLGFNSIRWFLYIDHSFYTLYFSLWRIFRGLNCRREFTESIDQRNVTDLYWDLRSSKLPCGTETTWMICLYDCPGFEETVHVISCVS